MKLDLIAEVWNMMKESVITTDRETVAENIVSILIDNDFSAADIRSSFRDDLDVMTALKYHIDDAISFETADDAFEYEDFDEFVDYSDEDEEDY